MHTRSLRLAFLSSLGLIPLGCAGEAAVSDDLLLRGSDASAGPAPDGGHVTSRLDGGTRPQPRPQPERDGGPLPLAACGESTALLNGDLPPGRTQRSSLAAQDLFTGIEQCANGVQHRPAAVTCSVGLPRPLPPDPGADAGSEPRQSQVAYLYASQLATSDSGTKCESDAECTERPYGFCAPGFGAPPSPDLPVARCNYGCVEDADCGAGYLCQCDDPVGRCVPTDCQSDADCGGSLLCAAWQQETGCGSDLHYSCQSPSDQCNTSEDCSGSWCSVVDGARQCVPFGPVCGRPFLVEGGARLAELRSGNDWASAIAACEPAALTAAESALSAQHWARSALMEHASIAAFARFTLQLMHLGAPRDLIERSQQAMLDETAHARACFALASRYLGSPVEPGPLAMDGALDEHGLEAIVVLTFREGCVGETVAALEAREALDRASDPEARAALGRIAADEQSHAELAWRFVSWALGQNASLRQLLDRELSQLEAERFEPIAAADDAECPEHGVLSERRRALLRRAAVAEVVVPCLRRVLALPPAPALEALA
jgi:hypothetical protein